MRRPILLIAICVLMFSPACLATQLGLPNGVWFSTGESGWSAQYDDQWNYRQGKGCATSYAGFFAVGDASVQKVALASNIRKIVSVSHQVTGYLGIWQSFCVIVRGY